MNKIDNLLSEISETRNSLLNHSIYGKLNDIKSISKFMEIHVFAVWDFMSLAKSLQKNLTCVETPWYPTKDKVSRRLINEIVLGEESDIDQNNNPVSHFELYVESMNKIGSLKNTISMIPGLGNLSKDENAMEKANDEMKKTVAIIDSMTIKERNDHNILDGSRRRRIANGSGTSVQDINVLIKKFLQMKKMSKNMGKFKKNAKNLLKFS